MAAGAACAALGFAGGAGYSAWRWADALRRRARHRSQVVQPQDAAGPLGQAGSALDAQVVALMRRQSIDAAQGGSGLRLPGLLAKSGWFVRKSAFAGLDGLVSQEGFCRVRVLLALAGAAAGALVGAALSPAFAAVLGSVGCALGFTAPKRALRHRIDWRTQQMERHLPEMLDVVAIGMRSGLSFDRSLQIYTARFQTMLACELALAEKKWTSGLERRDEALRQLAATYDSLVFARVVEAIVRSIRFGTSMVESLEAAAREARVTYRANRQEQVAKAPVKMMVPTGTLILPAMLVMVLGPVLLEMMGGGS